MKFQISFHGPFRVSTGAAELGVDDTVDPDDPLPGSSLKGVTRAAAVMLIGPDHRLVRDVFGGNDVPSPWSWSAATIEGPTVRRRARVQIDHRTATALEHGFTIGEEVHAAVGNFTVDPLRRLAATAATDHRLVLRCASAAVHSLGAGRRRGLGWVSITDAEHGPVQQAEIDRLLNLVGDQ